MTAVGRRARNARRSLLALHEVDALQLRDLHGDAGALHKRAQELVVGGHLQLGVGGRPAQHLLDQLAGSLELAVTLAQRLGEGCDLLGAPLLGQLLGNLPAGGVDAGLRQAVPEGMRLAINITDPQIENWLDSRGYTGAKRRTAKIFAVAMRDYGAIILETGCWGINLETDGILDTRTGGSRDIWARNGITAISGNANPHGDLLAGLITQSNLYVVNPPPG